MVASSSAPRLATFYSGIRGVYTATPQAIAWMETTPAAQRPTTTCERAKTWNCCALWDMSPCCLRPWQPTICWQSGGAHSYTMSLQATGHMILAKSQFGRRRQGGVMQASLSGVWSWAHRLHCYLTKMRRRYMHAEQTGIGVVVQQPRCLHKR